MFMPDRDAGPSDKLLTGRAICKASRLASRFGQAEQVRLRINAAVVPVRKGDVQSVAQIADPGDGDSGKAFGEAVVEAGTGAVRAFAGQSQALRRELDLVLPRRTHYERRKIRA